MDMNRVLKNLSNLSFCAKLLEDHKKKSNIIKKLKKKLKNRISINTLKEYLSWGKEHEVDARDFVGWGEFDDEAYGKAIARKEARIELLEKLIIMKERD